MLKVVNTEKGRAEVVTGKWWTHFYNLIFDSNAAIRANGYGLYINLCEFTYGVESFYDCGILGDLVKQLAQEKDEQIMVLILTLLNILLDAEMVTRALLNSNVLALLNGHLTSRRWEIRQLAAENLGSVSFNEAGKEAAIEALSIPPLCHMLTDTVSEVRTSAVRALASLAQLKEGKIQIYDLDKLDAIMALLYDLDAQTRLNTVQLIAAVAEYPPAREKFQSALVKLGDMRDKHEKAHPLVAEYAAKAVECINWTP